MTGDQPTRREIMRPLHLLGLAFAAAVFSGVITLVSMGAFQAIPQESVQRAIVMALIVAGIAFIATLVIIALLMLAVDPAQVSKRVDRPVLYPDETPDAGTDSGSTGGAHGR
ncbi:amino acid transporter [Microbacterium radiodurans]|uniref:Amino acid transporter n=1 Tax=Microbacterium radiodurans TaxID=661398 RepID=A0A5J5IVP0_9MICO|nr:amino acid transporter [Microbacterium radiodurans]KAA9089201.1 amino acid transporter [Microbacterium radiodurans]